MEPDDEDFTEDVYTFVCDYREFKQVAVCRNGLLWYGVAAVEIEYVVEDDDFTILDSVVEITATSEDGDVDPPSEVIKFFYKAFDEDEYMDSIRANH